MAITSSAKKAIRVSLKKRVFNTRTKRAVDSVVKNIRKALSEKNVKEATALLPKAYKAIDKALKTNYLKKNTAARMKSRITKLINKIK